MEQQTNEKVQVILEKANELNVLVGDLLGLENGIIISAVVGKGKYYTEYSEEEGRVLKNKLIENGLSYKDTTFYSGVKRVSVAFPSFDLSFNYKAGLLEEKEKLERELARINKELEGEK